MPIFTDRKSVAIDSPRHLTIRTARRNVALEKIRLGIDEGEEDPLPDLDPGEEILRSYWTPSLEAGKKHHISVTQTVDAKNGDPTLTLTADQGFYVDAPQFNLPEGSIHSCYPPPGYTDDHRILPHIVLTDPHLPWERWGANAPPPSDKKPRNRVPWLALFSFTQDELQLDPTLLDGPGSIFRDTSDQLKKPVQQTQTMAVNMAVGDLWATKNVSTPVVPDDGQPDMKDQRGDIIFLKSDLFTSLFSNFDENGKQQTPKSPDTTQYQYLSHVRKINTMGMAIAGVEDIGIFSVVIGNRAGPLTNTTNAPVSVHLCSIEGVKDMQFPITNPHVALCSLYSWNYSVLPPGRLNVHEAFQAIGGGLSVLRPPDVVISKAKANGDMPTRLLDRLKDGYSLVKYRTQTGEQTVALFRGPLTPTIVPPIKQLDKCSTSGIDFQIMDRELGIMDITYSAAWQLGRTLALGDQAFTAALSRIRTAIHKEAMKETKLATVKAKSPFGIRSREDIIRDLPQTIQSLSDVHLTGTDDSSHPLSEGGPLRRWARPRLTANDVPDLSFDSPDMKEDDYLEKATAAARKLALGKDGKIYDETNIPESTDWMTILAWVLSHNMFLSGVPAHYLITDASHLEREQLRFFHIDINWVDAMLDGSLSLGNHMGFDLDRQAIKTALNDYIRSKPDLQPHSPQLPSYGFFLRSDLVTMFPDLKVTTQPETLQNPGRAPLLRHDIISDGVMLALVDRIPGSPDFNGLIFTQPPHQQRFAVGDVLDADKITVTLRRQYTVDAETRVKDPNLHVKLPTDSLPTLPSSPNNFFVWGTSPGQNDLRILRLPYFAEKQKDVLVANMGTYKDGDVERKYFDEDTATSALYAMQLNDPIYKLVIDLNPEDEASGLKSLAPPDSGMIEGPRVLNALRAVRIPKLGSIPSAQPRDSDADSDDSDGSSDSDESEASTNPTEPDHDHLIAIANYKRPGTYSAPAGSLIANMAPNFRPMMQIVAPPTPSARTAVATTKTSSSSSPQAFRVAQMVGRVGRGGGSGEPPFDGPANPPTFHISVFTPARSVVILSKNLRQDIVFNVQVGNNSDPSGFKIKELDIDIPTGPADPNNPTLIQSYDGTGAIMLKNLRFNVLTTNYIDPFGKWYLRIRIISRNESGSTAAIKVNELSCLLNLALLNVYPVQTQAYIKSSVVYAGYKNEDPQPLSDVLVTVALK